MSSHCRSKRGLIVVFSWSALLLPLQVAEAFQAGGQVQGKVILDNDGSPLPGVTVTLVQVGAAPRNAFTNLPNAGTVAITPISGAATGAVTTATAASASNGAFSVSGLASGQFAVCVKDPKGSVIDPCSWTDSETTVPVQAASLSSGLVVRIKKASTVSVRINDTAQALAQKSSEPYPPHVLVGAFDTRGGFHPAQELKDSTGITYVLAIPVDSPIRLTVYSTSVQLATAANATVPKEGYTATFVQPASQGQTNSFTLNAIGRN